MTQERAQAGRGTCADFLQVPRIRGVPQKMLPQFQKQRAKLVLHLDAMEIHRYLDAGEGTGAVKDAMIFAHDAKFDREDVRGLSHVVAVRKKRDSFALLLFPPNQRRIEASKLGGVQRLERAQNVQIGP